jgi:carboxymethylenebutenolidase
MNSPQDLIQDPHLKSLTPEVKFNRRTFLASSLATGFALAVQPVCAQTVITTDTQGLEAGEVKIPVKDGTIPAYRAMPATGTGFATILVASEIWGVHEYIKDVCRRLAKAGYCAIAPELFVRQGDPSKLATNQEIIGQIISKAPDAQVMADLDATVAWAKSTGKANVAKLGITGFCWGGRTTLMYAAHNPGVKAAVAWYGPTARSYFAGDKTALEVAGQIKGAVLGLYGGADAGIPNETVEKMRDALKAAGNSNVEFVIYPDMPHAFHADYRPTYRKEAADDGWKRCLAWFKRHGVA